MTTRVEGPGNPIKLKAAERRIKSLRLRQRGLTYAQIGETLGVSSKTAYRDVKKELEKIQKTCAEEAELVREIELRRLDELWSVANVVALNGDLKAIDRCLRIQERRAKLLGLDAAESVAVRHSGEITTWLDLYAVADRAQPNTE
jgi:predicted DNA-binding protein (UPF0251 family)